MVQFYAQIDDSTVTGLTTVANPRTIEISPDDFVKMTRPFVSSIQYENEHFVINEDTPNLDQCLDAECRRRILQIADEDDQRNINSAILKLLSISLDRSLTKHEKSVLKTLNMANDRIRQIRQNRDYLLNNITIRDSFREDYYWPKHFSISSEISKLDPESSDSSLWEELKGLFQ